MTDDDIRKIRKEYKLEYGKGAPMISNVMELAKRYGVAQETIRKIAKGKTYKWVK
jgi:hypothetical protein